ncbi:MAG: hypothetical protein ACI9N9_000312 [Enterobacterales bacterium]|jgi:hypothetical protein
MKNTMFQYATRHKILADTDLITLDEAVTLFDKNKSDYIERLDKDEEPQMCIWIDCDTNDSYGKTLHNWYADDFKVIDGELYQKM